MSCESSITDLTMEMFEEEDCKDQLFSHIKELHEAVTAMKSAFTEAQQQLEGVQGDDGKLKEEIESTKTQCQQQSSEILRLVLNLQTEMGSVKEMVKTTQLMQHGMQSAIHTLLLDRDFLLDELAKNGAISETVRGRLHTRLNGYIGRPSSGSQSTNDSGVALLGENGSNKSSTTGSQNNHATLSASVSNDNSGSNQLLLHHHHGLGSSSPVGGVPYLNPGGSNGNNGGGGNQFQDSLPVSEHHLLNHHLPLGPPQHHMINPHVQEYLNTHHQLHQQHQLRALYHHAHPHVHHNGEMVATSGAGTPGGGCNQNGVMAGCCYPTIPLPPPLTYPTEVGPGGIVYDSDSSLTLAAAKSLSLSNSLSKQCGLELDHQQQQIMLDDENKSKKGTRRNSSSNDSSASFKDAVKCSSGRTCDVTGGGVSVGASGSSGDPSCYNSDAELVLTDDSNPSGIMKYNGQCSSGASSSTSMMSFKENQRMKVAKELMDTERKYCHTLKTIQDTFAMPLKNSGILSMKDINTLFPEEVFKLYEKHCGLLTLLEERLAAWKNKPTVGDVLERFINGEDANVLRLYTSYVNDFPEVLKTFHKLCRSSTDFTRFLKSTLEHPTCGGLDLGAFLLTPVQRMPRYILLLKQMMKFTDVGHPDYKNISICLDRLREYLKRLNDSMEHSFQLVTAQISPQPHEPLLEKLMGFSSKNTFPRASTSSQSSTGGDHELHQQQVVHKVRYKRSTSVPRSSHSSTSEAGGPKSMPAGGAGQKEVKSKLKSRSKSDWTVCNNNGVSGSKTSIIQEDGTKQRCMSCNCAGVNSSGNVQKLPGGCGGDPRAQHHHSRFKGKKNVFERTLSDSDINSDGDEGSLVEVEEPNGRKFSTSKSLHDFNQDDEDGNLDWFISEPSLCEMKHGGVVRHDVVITPDEESGRSRASSSLRRNMMIRPMTTNPSGGRVIARLQRASESEMNLHMLEKSSEVKEKAGKGSKGKMSLRNSLKNIFSIKKRSNRALQISHPIPPTLSENSSTTNTTPSTSAISFLGHHHHHQHHHHHGTPEEHQSMPDPLMLSSSYNESGGYITPNGGDSGSVNSCEPKTSVSLPYVPSTSSTTSMASNASSNNGAASAHHRYVKNKLAQPKFPRTPFVKKHSAHAGGSSGSSAGVVDVYSK